MTNHTRKENHFPTRDKRRKALGSVICALFILALGFILPGTALAFYVQIPFDQVNTWTWHDRDFGPGSGYDITGGILTMYAGGSDVWTGSDRRDFYYMNDYSGDFDIIVQILNQENTNPWAKAGLMVKNRAVSAEDDSSVHGYVMVAVTPGNGYAMQWDGDDNGYLSNNTNTDTVSFTWPGGTGTWLKLKKTGTTFTGEYWGDPDGDTNWNWILIDTVVMGSANVVQDVGMFVTSHQQDVPSDVAFGAFFVENGVAAVSWTITATAGANGTINPVGATVISQGNDQTYTVTPNAGYEVTQVLADAAPVTLTGNQYTFTNVTADHTIEASFNIITNTITATAGANGSITPTGAVTVNYGADQEFTVSADPGYEVDTFLVNGVTETLPANKKWNFTNVTASQTIDVTFRSQEFIITSSAGANGAIDPDGAQTVTYGNNQAFAVTPDGGYIVDTVLVDASPAALTDNGDGTFSYTFTNVTATHTIDVTFTNDPSFTDNTVPGCDVSVSTDYGSGFDTADFDFTNIDVNANGEIELQTGAQAIDPNSIIIPFKQEVAATFIYEGAGYVSDFGYILHSDAVEADGVTFKGWNNIPLANRHVLFRNIIDDVEQGSCCGGGNGILDSDSSAGGFPTSVEADLATYIDGTGILFAVDGDGTVTPKDMRKILGTFDAGTELVFFLTANQNWDTNNTTGVFFSKQAWNPDVYTACTPGAGDARWINEAAGIFYKTFDLGVVTAESCVMDGGWLAQPAIDRLDTIFGITLAGDYDLTITDDGNYPHVIVGAPANDPNQWILGWEDLTGAGDADYNDMVFRIERKTGGVAELKSSEAITPAAADAFYTAVTFAVYDDIPCAGETDINYELSIDNGVTWTAITNWDIIKEVTCGTKTKGNDVANWTAGTPQCTFRSVRIDFASLGISGRELIWKATLESEDENSNPKIVDVEIDADVSTHGSISRSSPISQANVLYSGSYETPALSWGDKIPRGHLIATRLYDPEDPTATDAFQIWDAGAVMNSLEPSTRNVLYPTITTTAVANEVLGTGTPAGQSTFTGTIANHPISATTLSITDTVETFVDLHTDVLEGSLGGTGTINRFTGVFSVTFNNPPGNGVEVKANYTYYTASSTLTAFTGANVTNAMLGLSNEFVAGEGFTYDLDNDGDYDEADGDWLVNWTRGYKDGVSTKKEWLLGPIDHSVPALQTPPGTPRWFFGTQVPQSEKTSYETFRDYHNDTDPNAPDTLRPTVLYVGARDGQIHVFDAGTFRWGDNPNTADITEARGYFDWSTAGDASTVDYGTGQELWSFIPANLLARLKNNLLQGDDRAMVDASPTLADVYIDTTDDSIPNPTWKTVLMSAEGNGGDTIFCLDVTDPANPSFLWEFSDPDLYRSRSSPAVAQIGRITAGGETHWAAFFVSGKTYDNTLYPSIYWIDIEDGSVIHREFLTAEVALGPSGAGGVPSGQPAIVDSDANGYIDRIYIGTDKGYMYKVNIPDDPDVLNYNINQCVINQDWDYVDESSATQTVPEARRYQPIYASPAVVVDNEFSETGQISYKIRIFYGTSDSPFFDENINTATTRYYFFSYLDTAEKGECTTLTSELDWFFELPEGNRVFASAFAAAGQIYFGTSTAETEDPCAAQEAGANNGMIYAFSNEGGSPVFSAQVGNIVTAPLVEDQHLYYRTSSGLTSLGSSNYNTETILGGTAENKLRSWKELF